MDITTDDRLKLQELIWRYSIARDDKDMSGLLACFVPDAKFHRRGETVEGLDDIQRFFERSMARYDVTTHTNHGQILDPDGSGSVRGLIPGHAELVLDGKLCVASYRYNDIYRKTGDSWLIAERSLNFLYAMPVEDLALGFKDKRRIRWPGTDAVTADYPETLPTWFG